MDDSPDLPRDEVARALPALIRQALESYRTFMDQGEPDNEDAKAFAAHQSACKAAVAHVDALFRLQRLTAPQGGDGARASASGGARREDPLNQMVRDARSAVGAAGDAD